MKNWDNYRFVLALHRQGSIRLAADVLGVNTVTVSRRLERVTEELGARLFDYRDGRWIITDAGKTIVRVAEALEQAHKQGMSALSGTAGVLRGPVTINTIAFISNFFLSSKISRLTAQHPGLTPTIDASERSVSLAKGEADVALRLYEPTDGRLFRVPVCWFPVGLFKSDRGDESDWVGLPAALDWLPEMRMGYEVFGKPPSIRMDSYPAIAKAVRDAGMIGILPTCISSYFSGISPFNPDQMMVHRQGWVAYHEINRGQPRVAAAVEWIRGVLGDPRACACHACQYGVPQEVANSSQGSAA